LKKGQIFIGDDRLVLVMARDGFVQHYTSFGIPASGIFLNPRVELSASA